MSSNGFSKYSGFHHLISLMQLGESSYRPNSEFLNTSGQCDHPVRTNMMTNTVKGF